MYRDTIHPPPPKKIQNKNTYKIKPPHKLEIHCYTKLCSMHHLNISIVQTICAQPPVSFKKNYISPETDLTHKFIITQF